MEKEYGGKIGLRAGMVVLMIVFAINLLAGVGSVEAVFTERDCPLPPRGYHFVGSNVYYPVGLPVENIWSPLPSNAWVLHCQYSAEEGYCTPYINSDVLWFSSIEEATKNFAGRGGILYENKCNEYGDTKFCSFSDDTWNRIRMGYNYTEYIKKDGWKKPTKIKYDIREFILYKNCVLFINYKSDCYVDFREEDIARSASDKLEEDLKALIDKKGFIDEQPSPYRGRDYDRERPSPRSSIYEPHSPEGSKRSDDDCFIATAAYGTPMNKNINVLREFRDDVLIENSPGETFVRIYYLSSPPIADVLTSSEWMRTATRVLLITPLVYVTKTLLNSTFQFILMVCLVVGLILARKHESIAFKFLKSFGFGFLTAVILSTAVFALGYAGHSNPICAIIAAHILPIIIPVSLGLVALSLVYPSYLERQS